MDEIKVLPHDLVSEQAVLGSIFINPDKMIEVTELLKPEDFYRPAHKILFQAMLGLFESGEAIDIVTVKSALEASNELDLAGNVSS